MRSLSHGSVVVVLAVALLLLTMGIAGSWVGDDPSVPNAFLSAWGTLIRCGSIALLWLGMALGFGGFLVDRLGLDRRSAWERVALEGGLGVAAALWLNTLLGSLPATWFVGLVSGGGAVAWVLVGVGFLLFILRIRGGRRALPGIDAPLVLVAAAPPTAILLLAATSEPGWLWGSEFNGYDALSYHLQLPREWLALGRITTLDHNVYSAFPSFVEAAFLQCFILARGLTDGALAAQCLAALVTVLTAINVGCVARRLGGEIVGVLAAALYLAVPWVVVVGSLAYNDGFVGLFLSSALLVALKLPAGRNSSARGGIALGLLIGAACGAKLTAVGFMALPVAAAVVLLRPRRALALGLVALPVAFLVLSPWLVRNGLATGNPVFPFLTGIFGTGHWTEAQAATFAIAHASELPMAQRVGLLLERWLLFGMGSNPRPGEPWAMLWSVLPWLGVAGLVALTVRRRPPAARIVAVALGLALLAQLAFWLAATHVQSRFLVPSAALLAVAAAAGIGRGLARAAPRLLTVAALVLGAGPVLVFRLEPNKDHSTATAGAPAYLIGTPGLMSGDLHDREVRARLDASQIDAARQAQATAPLAYWVNHYLPAEGTEPLPIVLVGEATPFWYRRSGSYSTVWDRGLLERVAETMPDSPELWASALSGLGAKFVLVNRGMLANWRERGWLDPTLTPERIDAFIATTQPVPPLTGAVYLGVLPAPTAAPAAPAPPAQR